MRQILPAIALFALAPFAAAQCFDTIYGTGIGVGPDTVFPIQPIGFAFPLAGTTYTDVHITDKGYVYLSNAGVPAPGVADYSATAAELASGSPRICALWSDIQVTAANTGQVHIKSTASDCTITWVNAQCYGATSGLFNMQMKLSVSGTIQFIYGPGTVNNSTLAAWQVGITGVSPGMGAVLPAGNDLSAGGATVDNTLFEEFTAPATFDLASNGLLLVPTNPGWAFIATPPTTCANVANYGSGCVGSSDTIYELFAAATGFDLAASTTSYLRVGGGYQVTNLLPGTYVVPSATATSVAFADDIEQTVSLSASMPIAGGTTTSLTICSNGRIALGATGNGNAWTPVAATFEGFAATTIAPAWHDYNPTLAGSGLIKFEEVAGIAYVTWDAVYSYGTTLPDTFQVQFDLATGNMTVVYVSSSLAGNAVLAGYSVGGAGVNPTVVDLSTALAGVVAIGDTSGVGLGLAATNLPTLGNPAFTLQVNDVPALIPLAFVFFGSTVVNPGLDLTFLGMPGCYGYTSADLGSGTVPVTGTSGTISLGIPNNPALAGITLSSQGVAFSLATPANLVTSNGTAFTLGN